MARYVEIEFDCLPLRSVGDFSIPDDASPVFRARCQRILDAIAAHGTHNSYYLHNGTCRFHFTNAADVGMVEFQFEGTVLTDSDDRVTRRSLLETRLARETCDWLTEPIVAWLCQTVDRAVQTEFDRYIEAGDLARTEERLRRMQAASDAQGGFMGMYL